LGDLRSKDNKCKKFATFCATQNTKANVGASQKAKTKALHLKRQKNILKLFIRFLLDQTRNLHNLKSLQLCMQFKYKD
jgi:hypothetical protein